MILPGLSGNIQQLVGLFLLHRQKHVAGHLCGFMACNQDRDSGVTFTVSLSCVIEPIFTGLKFRKDFCCKYYFQLLSNGDLKCDIR